VWLSIKLQIAVNPHLSVIYAPDCYPPYSSLLSVIHLTPISYPIQFVTLPPACYPFHQLTIHHLPEWNPFYQPTICCAPAGYPSHQPAIYLPTACSPFHRLAQHFLHLPAIQLTSLLSVPITDFYTNVYHQPASFQLSFPAAGYFTH
jgi:hypothetical protein